MFGVIIGVHLFFMFKKVSQSSLKGAMAPDAQFREVNYIYAVCEALRGSQRKSDRSRLKQIVTVTHVT